MGNNSIINSLKRLERVGNETSRVTAKLKTACNEVAKKIVEIMKSKCEDAKKDYYPGEFPQVQLPRGYRVILIDTENDYRWTLIRKTQDEWQDHPYDRSLAYMPNDMTRGDALQFAKDISEGLLDEIAEWVEKKKLESEEALKTIESAKENL